MDLEPIVNPMIRTVKELMGHGGYACSRNNQYDYARFSVGLPETCVVLMILKGTNLKVNISIYSIDFSLESIYDLYDPNFDPDELINTIIKTLKLLEKGFKIKRAWKASEFPHSVRRKAYAMMSVPS